MITRTIPSTGEALPAIGLGTWQSFDVHQQEYSRLEEVLRIFYKAGGRLIDSSPMYRRSEKVIGDITVNMNEKDEFFYATKVWTTGAEAGRKQIADSYRLMKRKQMDLIQIHNLVDWETHLPYLRKLKDDGQLRYTGITHYQDSSHETLAELIRKEKFDFVQFNYSILNRHAEKFLLPLCADKGVATIINRPFGEGALFRKFAGKALPAWAMEAGIKSWGSYFLHFILAHPAVTCVIPATGNPVHMAENLRAVESIQAVENMRERMVMEINS
jgi:diketogulonate reductase-like aldo/keto reductase